MHAPMSWGVGVGRGMLTTPGTPSPGTQHGMDSGQGAPPREWKDPKSLAGQLRVGREGSSREAGREEPVCRWDAWCPEKNRMCVESREGNSPGACAAALCPEGRTVSCRRVSWPGPAENQLPAWRAGAQERSLSAARGPLLSQPAASKDNVSVCKTLRRGAMRGWEGLRGSQDGWFGRVGKVAVMGMVNFASQRPLFQGWKCLHANKQYWSSPAPRLLWFWDGPSGKEPKLTQLCPPFTQLPGLGPGARFRAQS